ncbi:hypothetical protein [Fluviicola sp.]|uniref:hypothetical protein n=1 Tax=Fluviicola sp. TaxID=1917219 RepID=UPI003D2D593F
MSKPILTLPCKQNLQTLEKRSQDYYCNSCDKVLTDFRGKSDSEIESILANSTKQICGIMYPSQFDYKRSELIIPRYQSRIGLSLLGILGFLGPILSSCEEKPKTTEVRLKKDAFQTLHFPLILKGTLTDNNSSDPLCHSEVELIQNGKVIRKEKTNEKGEFEIKIREKDLKDETFELAYHSPQYFSDTLEENISTVGTSPLLLQLYAMPAPIIHIENRVNEAVLYDNYVMMGFARSIPSPTLIREPLIFFDAKRKLNFHPKKLD